MLSSTSSDSPTGKHHRLHARCINQQKVTSSANTDGSQSFFIVFVVFSYLFARKEQRTGWGDLCGFHPEYRQDA